MTSPSYSQAQAAEPARLAKRASGLRIALLAATVMILVQDALGFWVSADVEVPTADKGIVDAVGRALSDGPVAISVHAGLGLLLIITAISVTVRAILARRIVILALSLVGLAALLAANMTGARFVDTGDESDMTVMAMASLVALSSYLLCLPLIHTRRSGLR